MPSIDSGLFITLEGIEGAGKSTQARLLREALESTPHRTILTREPGGGGRIGETLRDLLKDPAVWRDLQLAEVYLYAAARAQHLESLILPELASGAVVICDRYVDSTRAYQGYGRGRSIDLIERLHELTPLDTLPQRTLLLDVTPETGLSRARDRRTEEHPGYDDEDLQFFERVRMGFLTLSEAEPSRFRVLDASKPENEVHRSVVEALADLIPGLVAAL